MARTNIDLGDFEVPTEAQAAVLPTVFKGYDSNEVINRRMLDNTYGVRNIRLTNGKLIVVVAELVDVREFVGDDGQPRTSTTWEFIGLRVFESDQLPQARDCWASLVQTWERHLQDEAFGEGDDDWTDSALAEDESPF